MIVPGSLNPNLIGASSAPATIEYTGFANRSGGGGSSPYSVSVDVGAASPNRNIIVAPCIYAAARVEPSSVTVGGISCTKIETGTVGGTGSCTLWITDSPLTTGTTATVVMSWSGTILQIGAMCFAARNLRSRTPTAAAAGVLGGGGLTVGYGSFSVQNGGFVLSTAFGTPNTASSFTISGTLGAAEIADQTFGLSNVCVMSAAAFEGAAAGNITHTFANSPVSSSRAGSLVCMR